MPRIDRENTPVLRRRWVIDILTYMDKTCTVKRRMSDIEPADVVPGTPAERIALVWPLTREIISLSKHHDAERRLQRNIASLGRREG